jgi:thiol:disulfide interchange protein DsbC
MRIPRRLIAGLLGLAAATVAVADTDAVRKAMQSRLPPSASITEVRELGFAGLYEVVLGSGQVLYTDKDARRGFAGPFVDFETRVNLTEQRLTDLRRVDFSALPLDKAIRKVKGKGERRIAVFSDPDCPFCKQLEPYLDQLDNVTIYTFLYPLTTIHPDAARKATLIWCAKDRMQAWDDWMLRGRLPEGGNVSCATPIFEIVDLAQKLGINGTPGIVFNSGRMIPGLIPKEQVEAYLAEPGRS